MNSVLVHYSMQWGVNVAREEWHVSLKRFIWGGGDNLYYWEVNRARVETTVRIL